MTVPSVRRPDGRSGAAPAGGAVAGRVVVVGCGNLLRGDDGVGPILIRELWTEGVPAGVELVDGGTAGMDVGFKMAGADRVVLIDAAATGAEPGTIYRVPGPELEQLPPLEGLHSHLFRWDHALAFARWLLKGDYPDDIVVFLVEVGDVTLGAELSEPVRTAMARLKPMIAACWEHPDAAGR